MIGSFKKVNKIWIEKILIIFCKFLYLGYWQKSQSITVHTRGYFIFAGLAKVFDYHR